MFKRVLQGFVLGTCGAAWLPVLLLAVAAAVAVVGQAWRQRPPWLLVGMLLGWFWFNLHVADYGILRDAASGEREIVAEVIDLPRVAPADTRFRVRTDDGLQLRLIWMEPSLPVQPGQRLALTVRLRPARGLANPGAFDFETWAFAAGVHGTGYVVSGVALEPASSAAAALLRTREWLSASLATRLEAPAARRLLPALAVADRRSLTDEDYAVLQRTGTSHLLAISGLHIGLVAGLGLGLGAVAWGLRCGPGSRRGLALVAALPLACGYAALAGFSLPTVRALVMLLVVAIAWWSRSRIGLLGGLTLAAAAVFLVDPASPAAPGFWLSFGAVAALGYAVHGRGLSRPRWLALPRAQLAVTLGLLPVTAALGLLGGLIAPLANLFAIPWISFAVLPWLLLGTLMLLLGLPLANLPLTLAELGTEWLWQGLVWAARLPLPQPELAVPLTSAGIAALMLGVLGLTLPRGVPGRSAALILVVAVLWPATSRPPSGSIDLHLLDVGQGLSLVVDTGDRRLLYDAGPASRAGWDAGSTVVAPWLIARGWTRPDRVVLSHADSDHAGGWNGLLASGVEPRLLLTSAHQRLGGETCLAGDRWQWAGATFEVLHPGPGLPYLGNDSSCVLLVTVGERRLLLPGDISAAVEARLLDASGRLDLLVAAHHGSRSSSSAAFVDATQPRWTLVSVGHDNRYGMPHPEVIDRLSGSRLLSTAECGYLHLRIGRDGVAVMRAERLHRQRPWHPEVRCLQPTHAGR